MGSEDSEPSPSIPCYVSSCNFRPKELSSLASHIRRVHGIVNGYACHCCGVRYQNKDHCYSHIKIQHGSKERLAKNASLALARYSRFLFLSNNPSAKVFRSRNFWRGKKSSSLDTIDPTTGLPWDIQYTKTILQQESNGDALQDTTILDTVGKATKLAQSCSRDQQDTNLKVSRTLGHNRLARTFGAYDKVIIYVDSRSLADLYKTHEEEKEDNDEEQDEEDDEEQDEDDDKAQDVDDDEEQDVDVDEEQVDEATKAVSLERETRPVGLKQDNIDYFRACLSAEFHDEIQYCLEHYETRQYMGEEYRVSRKLDNVPLNLGNIVCASYIPKESAWKCQVPQCCTLLNDRWAMDLHLEAHGSMKWYCGDVTCRTSSEMSFERQKDFDHHVEDIHMGSRYTIAASRRTPAVDVLSQRLQKFVNFTTDEQDRARGKRAQNWIGFNRRHGVVLDRIADENSSLLKLSRHEDLCWQQVRIFNANYEEELHFQQKDENDFLTHIYKHRINYDSRLQRKHSMHTVELFTVKKLISLEDMYFDEAKDFFLTARKFIRVMRIDNIDQLADLLGLPYWSPGEGLDFNLNAVRYLHKYSCPWQGCNWYAKSLPGARLGIIRHILVSHLNCRWQCPQQGCEYCIYQDFKRLEDHRLSCHVGVPLQCGHNDCSESQIYSSSLVSRGFCSLVKLRRHFEIHLNLKLGGSQLPGALNPSILSNKASFENKYHQLPTKEVYLRIFRGNSPRYLTSDRMKFRLTENYQILGAYDVQSRVDIRGRGICSGFFLSHYYYPCVDQISLGLDTAMLLFVPSLRVFTLTQTCDFCIHIMSIMSRPLAEPPLPFCFFTKKKRARRRIGIGASIIDHQSFETIIRGHTSPLPSAALIYKERLSNPNDVFIIDFESVHPFGRDLPLCPTEVTVRDGTGRVIVSCKINEVGITNSQYEDQLRLMGFTHLKSFQSARRIRGHPSTQFPEGAKSAKEIIDLLRANGLNKSSFLVEWSINGFDTRHLKLLIRTAGYSVDEILPSTTWSVIPDFSKWLPGLASYSLGNVMKLMMPNHPQLQRLHFSDADTRVLYDLLQRWVFVYSR